MPTTKHRIPGIESYKISSGKPTRFRFIKNLVTHKNKKWRQRLGFKGNKVVEVSFVPVKKR